jgi:hypothetical protein
MLVAVAIAIGVGVALTSLRERRLPGWPARRSGGYDITWATWSLLGCFTLPAIGRIVGAVDSMTAFEVWIGVSAIVLVGYSVQYGPRLLRPQGFANLRPSGATPGAGVALVAGLCIAGVGAWWLAHGIVAEGHVIPLKLSDIPPGFPLDALVDMQPTMPTIALIGWALIATIATGGFVLWWAGVPRPFFACLAVLYIGVVLWSETVWRQIGYDELVLGQAPGGLAILQVLSAVLLLTALPVSSQLRPSRTLDRFMSATTSSRTPVEPNQLRQLPAPSTQPERR